MSRPISLNSNEMDWATGKRWTKESSCWISAKAIWAKECSNSNTCPNSPRCARWTTQSSPCASGPRSCADRSTLCGDAAHSTCLDLSLITVIHWRQQAVADWPHRTAMRTRTTTTRRTRATRKRATICIFHFFSTRSPASVFAIWRDDF